jgi:ESS family glutamate:Na+ symporter
MELTDDALRFGSFFAFTLGIVVLFVGKRLNAAVPFLREFSIPEPVTGGLLFSILFTVVHALTGVGIEFDLALRDFLLVYFFTTIGINASVRDLIAGGKPLVILLLLTVVYMFAQNGLGMTVAAALGQPSEVGAIAGTVSLIGGHGTSIAWAPRFATDYGIANALEIGIACATFGLILASLMGGPLAKLLISRYGLRPSKVEPLDVGVPTGRSKPTVDHFDVFDAILAIHVCIIAGVLLNEGLEEAGVQLPLFVTCLFAGIVMTNLVPKSFPRITGTRWPSRTPAMALIADISLGAFLAMSLMSMQLWTLVDLAGPIFTILAAQTAMTLVFVFLLVFRFMGRNYDAAVISAGFAGYSMGATPTAMANMSAVTGRYGASHQAFIIVPLVGAFFIDLINAVLIPLFLNFF